MGLSADINKRFNGNQSIVFKSSFESWVIE